MNIETLDYEWDTLRVMQQVTQETGIFAAGMSGLVYRPFFNHRFGPPSLPPTKTSPFPKKTTFSPT